MIPIQLKKGFINYLACLGFLFLQGAQGQNRLGKYLPDHAKLQFAGGIGFLSAGVGYASKKDKLHTDLYYGYVPRSLGGIAIHSLTGKVTWSPVKQVNRGYTSIRPLTAGMLLNYTFGKQYFGFKPENYPYDYYGHPTNMHLAAFLGGAADYSLNKKSRIRKIGIYYEVITYDVELLSYLNNRNALNLTDIFSLSLGLRTSF